MVLLFTAEEGVLPKACRAPRQWTTMHRLVLSHERTGSRKANRTKHSGAVDVISFPFQKAGKCAEGGTFPDVLMLEETREKALHLVPQK
jgi:hypothetical protein